MSKFMEETERTIGMGLETSAAVETELCNQYTFRHSNFIDLRWLFKAS